MVKSATLPYSVSRANTVIVEFVGEQAYKYDVLWYGYGHLIRCCSYSPQYLLYESIFQTS